MTFACFAILFHFVHIIFLFISCKTVSSLKIMRMACVNFVCNTEWINVFLNLLLVDSKFDTLKKVGAFVMAYLLYAERPLL